MEKRIKTKRLAVCMTLFLLVLVFAVLPVSAAESSENTGSVTYTNVYIKKTIEKLDSVEILKDNDERREKESKKITKVMVPNRDEIEREQVEEEDPWDNMSLTEILLSEGFTEWQAVNIIGWMQGEADYSTDVYLGYCSANAIMNELLMGIYPSSWGYYYYYDAIYDRAYNQELMWSTDYCIKLALKNRDYGIKACYGLYLGAGEGEPGYVSYDILSEGEPTAVWWY